MRTETPQAAPPGAIRAVPVRHPLRWAAAAIVLVLAAMFVHMLVTNPNFQWGQVRHYLTSAHVLSGVLATLWLTAIAMAIGIVGGVILAVMRLSPTRWCPDASLVLHLVLPRHAGAGPAHLLVQPRHWSSPALARHPVRARRSFTRAPTS